MSYLPPPRHKDHRCALPCLAFHLSAGGLNLGPQNVRQVLYGPSHLPSSKSEILHLCFKIRHHQSPPHSQTQIWGAAGKGDLYSKVPESKLPLRAMATSQFVGLKSWHILIHVLERASQELRNGTFTVQYFRGAFVFISKLNTNTKHVE